jgi:hypothetical protein
VTDEPTGMFALIRDAHGRERINIEGVWADLADLARGARWATVDQPIEVLFPGVDAEPTYPDRRFDTLYEHIIFTMLEYKREDNTDAAVAVARIAGFAEAIQGDTP